MFAKGLDIDLDIEVLQYVWELAKCQSGIFITLLPVLRCLLKVNENVSF